MGKPHRSRIRVRAVIGLFVMMVGCANDDGGDTGHVLHVPSGSFRFGEVRTVQNSIIEFRKPLDELLPLGYNTVLLTENSELMYDIDNGHFLIRYE